MNAVRFVSLPIKSPAEGDLTLHIRLDKVLALIESKDGPLVVLDGGLNYLVRLSFAELAKKLATP